MAGLFFTATATDVDTGDTSEFSQSFSPDADLKITKTANTSQVVVGQELVFTINVTNAGPSDASGVIMTDSLPSGAEFVSATTTHGTVSESGGVVTAVVGDLANGATATVTITVRATAVGTLVNTASVDGEQPDPDPDSRITPPLEIQVLPPSTTPVTVLSLVRYGYHMQATQLVLRFSGALDGATAENVNNYRLELLGRSGKVTRRIGVSSATYDAVAGTVTLRFPRRLYLFTRYRLTVNGSTAEGVRDASGQLIDGAGTGQAGSDYLRNFGKGILAGRTPPVTAVAARPQVAARGFDPAVVDAALASVQVKKGARRKA